MLWRTAPAVTELEEVTLDWLRQLVGLPVGFEGTINDTASSSSLYALAAAREAVEGLGYPPARSRRTARRAAAETLHLDPDALQHREGRHRAGSWAEGVEKIPTDEQFRMDPAALGPRSSAT